MRKLSAFQWVSDSRDQNRIRVTMEVVGWSKKAFQINQFCLSAYFFSSLHHSSCVSGLSTILTPKAYASVISPSEVKHDRTWHEQIILDVPTAGLTLTHLGIFWSLKEPAWLDQSPGSAVFPSWGFHPHPFLPFSHHLPRWLHRIPASHILTANAFFYRSLPSLSPRHCLGSLNQKCRPSPVVLPMWQLPLGGEEASIRVRLGCLLCFDLMHGVHMQFHV